MRLAALSAVCLIALCAWAEEPAWQWSQLAPLPDAEGVAGAFAGVSNGALIVAGGANFPRDKWAAAPPKIWHGAASVLEKPDGEWRGGFKLPHALAYGVSITTRDGVVCAGGSDSTRHFAEVFWLRWSDGKLTSKALPPLPRPCANACGALVDETIYVAGGVESPTAMTALKMFWALDLQALDRGWQTLPPWPGRERTLAMAATVDGSFCLIGGASLHADEAGKPVRDFLRDCFRFTPGRGWERLADLPHAVAAAPSPAPVIDGRVLILSGDDGANVTFEPLVKHPGFPREVLAYDIARNTWSTAGAAPFSRATTPVVKWAGGFVMPSGEVRPRERSSEVWLLRVGR